MKRFLFSSAALVSIFLLSCGPSPGKAKVVLQYMMWGTSEELKTVKEYIQMFEKQHPDIKVKILHVPQNYWDKLQTMITAGTPPDIMYISVERFPAFVEKGVFLDLQPFLEEDPDFIKQFYPKVVDAFKYQGHYYGIAKDFATLVMYYNVDMFDEAGVPHPKPGWTWKDFLEMAKKLTKDENGDGKPEKYGFVLETWTGEWLPWIWQNGGEIWKNGEFVLGKPPYLEANAQAFDFLRDLIYKYKVAPDPTVTANLQPSQMFLTGRCAMATYGRWYCMDLRNVTRFKWNTVELPRGKKKATTLFTVAYCIAKQTKHPREAWELVKFLTGPEGQKATARSGHAIPSMISIANSDYFLHAPLLPAYVDNTPHLTSIRFSRTYPHTVYWSQIEEILGRELDYIWRNQKPTVDVLVNIQKEVEQILHGS